MAKKVTSLNTFQTLGLDNTYAISVPAGTLAGPINMGVSGTIGSNLFPVMTPYGGLSSVDITAISLSASDPTYFGSVSTNTSLPKTLVHNQTITFTVVYDNTVTHIEPILIPFRVSVTTNNAAMSADAPGGALSGVQTFYSDINTLTAVGTRFLLWDSVQQHTMLYQEEATL